MHTQGVDPHQRDPTCRCADTSAAVSLETSTILHLRVGLACSFSAILAVLLLPGATWHVDSPSEGARQGQQSGDNVRSVQSGRGRAGHLGAMCGQCNAGDP